MRRDNEIQIHGLAQPIVLRNNPRARRFTLRVNHSTQQAILTLPPKTNFSDAETFLSSNLNWLKKQLAKIPSTIPLTEGNRLPLRGIEHLILYKEYKTGSGVVAIGEKDGHPTLCVSGRTNHAPRRLEDWLKKQARKDLEQRVTWHAHNLNLTPRKITVRDQTSRWGSCSSTGSLSFSWRLILAPPIVLDYVAAHEVAHLAEMNHGPRFWKLVRQTMPQMDHAQDWLKHQGSELHRYGPRNAR